MEFDDILRDLKTDFDRTIEVLKTMPCTELLVTTIGSSEGVERMVKLTLWKSTQETVRDISGGTYIKTVPHPVTYNFHIQAK